MRPLLILLFMCLSSGLQAADVFDGTQQIDLLDGQGRAINIGQIKYTAEGEKTRYTITMNDEPFSNEFLSMRPFKCLSRGQLMTCHLVYPYQKQGYITKTDLTDLEYDFLFLHKSATEYGINAWNGIYYDLTITESGLLGTLKEVDLNVLASPPEAGDIRPITEDMLYEADAENHLFPQLRIQ